MVDTLYNFSLVSPIVFIGLLYVLLIVNNRKKMMSNDFTSGFAVRFGGSFGGRPIGLVKSIYV